MKLEPRNTTRKIQAIMHPQKGLMTRNPREVKFYVYSKNFVPGEMQQSNTVFYSIADVDRKLLAISQYKKSTVIICSRCAGYVMRRDSVDNKCRNCFMGIDATIEQYQTSIDRFAATRSHSQFDSAGDSLGRFS